MTSGHCRGACYLAQAALCCALAVYCAVAQDETIFALQGLRFPNDRDSYSQLSEKFQGYVKAERKARLGDTGLQQKCNASAS